MKLKRRILSLILAACMIATASPIAFADDTTTNAVAQIGNTTYSSLSEAVKAAADNDTVTLLADTTENITISTAITLDLGGKTLTGTSSGSVITDKAASGTVTIENGTITGGKTNDKGAGIKVTGKAALKLNKVTMKNNSATLDGGAVYISSALTITDCTFESNSGYRGGAISSWNGTLTVSGTNSFRNNSAIKSASYSADGAAIFCQKDTSVVISGSTFEGNSADGNGGAVCIKTCTSTVSIAESTFKKNTSGFGGAVYLQQNDDTTITDSTFTGNTATGSAYYYGYGGAILVMMQKATVFDVEITGNNAFWGGGVFIYTSGTFTANDKTKLYNNEAKYAGDDVYISRTGTVTLPSVGSDSDWVLDDCTHLIDGWYDDTYGARWEAHADSKDGNHIETVNATSEFSSAKGIIAAHAKDPTGTITGTIFKDADSDAILDEGEAITNSGLTATLYTKDTEGNWVATETTATVDANTGVYTIEAAPGAYQVRLSGSPAGVNQECAVSEDTAGNKFTDLATGEITLAEDATVTANAGFYYSESGDIYTTYRIDRVYQTQYGTNAAYTTDAYTTDATITGDPTAIEIGATIPTIKDTSIYDSLNGVTYTYASGNPDTAKVAQKDAADNVITLIYRREVTANPTNPTDPTVKQSSYQIVTRYYVNGSLEATVHGEKIKAAVGDTIKVTPDKTATYNSNTYKYNNSDADPEARELTVTANTDENIIYLDYYRTRTSDHHSGGGTDIPDDDVPMVDTPDLDTVNHYAYIIGRDDGYVHPEAEITRAEVATIFFRLLTNDSRTANWAQTNSYSDVSEDRWYNHAISTLSHMGILNGYTDGTFRPDQSITRAEFVKMAVSFFQYTYDGNESFFSDIDGTWAEDYIKAAAKIGLVDGYTDGTFRPDNNITRAEAVRIVNNTIGRKPAADKLVTENAITWPDNQDTTKWYYADMQEATNSHDYTWDTDKTEETWSGLLAIRDWAALEREWATNASSTSPGDVVSGN